MNHVCAFAPVNSLYAATSAMNPYPPHPSAQVMPQTILPQTRPDLQGSLQGSHMWHSPWQVGPGDRCCYHSLQSARHTRDWSRCRHAYRQRRALGKRLSCGGGLPPRLVEQGLVLYELCLLGSIHIHLRHEADDEVILPVWGLFTLLWGLHAGIFSLQDGWEGCVHQCTGSRCRFHADALMSAPDKWVAYLVGVLWVTCILKGML